MKFAIKLITASALALSLVATAYAGSTSSSSRSSSGGFSSSSSSSRSSSSSFSSSPSKSYTAPSSSSSSKPTVTPSSPSPSKVGVGAAVVGGAAIGAGAAAASSNSTEDKPKSSGGFLGFGSKPSNTVTTNNNPAPKSEYNTQVNRTMSTQAYEKTQPKPEPKKYEPAKVNETRTVYVNNYKTVYKDRYIPPSTTYHNSYGSFSETFMWMMMYDAMFAHNHRDSDDYRRWRRDAEERAIHDEKVAKQLRELDAKVNELEASGVKKDSTYVPKEVPREIVYADTTLKQADTGHGFWWYFMWAIIIVILGCVVFFIWLMRA